MGVPTSEVGYTSATTGMGTTKSIRDMWCYWEKKKIISKELPSSISSILTMEAACPCKKLVSTYQNTHHKLKDNNF
jgi:hypothetical protein